MKFSFVAGGRYSIGSSREAIARCVGDWKTKLIDVNYNEQLFTDWIDKEYPSHHVQCEDFYLQTTLVSNKQALAFLASVPISVPESIKIQEPLSHPVWGVSRDWATQFADWMSRKDLNFSYRLPTETEWEIAARGPSNLEYPYGPDFDPTAANTIESGFGNTTPIYFHERTPGPFGHLDLAGNVEEWVFTDYYVYDGGRLVSDDLLERFGISYPILRGGSFACGGDLSRSARRHGPFPSPRFRFTGFRLVRIEK